MIKNNENEFLHLIEKLLTEKSFLSNSFLMKMKKTQKVSFSHSLNEMGICLDGELSQIYPLIDDDYEVLSIPVLDVFICSNDLKKELVKKMEVNLESIESKFVFDSSKNVKSYGIFLESVVRYFSDVILNSLGSDPDYFDFLFAKNSIISSMSMIGFKITVLDSQFYPAVPIELIFSQFIPEDILSQIVSVDKGELSGLAEADYNASLLVLERYVPGSIERFGLK